MTREADIEAMARALYEDWIAEDWPCEYCSWEQLPDKQTWLGRAQAAYAIVSKRIAALEAECELAWNAYRIAHDQAMSNGDARVAIRNPNPEATWRGVPLSKLTPDQKAEMQEYLWPRSTLSDKGTASDDR